MADIRVVVGADILKTKSVVKDDLKVVAKQINQEQIVANVKLGLDVNATKKLFEDKLNTIVNGLKLDTVKLDLNKVLDIKPVDIKINTDNVKKIATDITSTLSKVEVEVATPKKKMSPLAYNNYVEKHNTLISINDSKKRMQADKELTTNVQESSKRRKTVIQSEQPVYKQLNDIINEIGDKKINIAKLNPDKDFNVIQTYINQIETLQDNLKKLSGKDINLDLSNTNDVKFDTLLDGVITDQNQVNQLSEKWLKILRQIQIAKSQSEQRQDAVISDKSLFNKMFDKSKAVSNLQELERLKSDISSFGGNTAKLKKHLNTLEAVKLKQKEVVTSYKELISKVESEDVPFDQIANLDGGDKFLTQLNDYGVAFNNLRQEVKEELPFEQSQKKAAKFGSELERFTRGLYDFEKANDKLHKNKGAEFAFNGLLDGVKKLKSDLDLNGVVNEQRLSNLRKGLSSLNMDLDKLGLKGQTFGTKLISQFEKLGVYFSTATVMMGVWKQMKNTIQDVIMLDKIITDLSVATGNTRNETKELLNTYSELGKTFGVTTTQVAQAANDWLRQNKTVEETNKLIKDSLMLGKLGNLNTDEATKALTSTTKGYKMSVEETTSVVDNFTAVDMKAAVSAGYIATAIAETATSARLAGVDLDRLTGYITTVGEISQDGAESVGVFFKSMFARMSNIKEGKLIDPETQENISDVETVLGNLGIKLRENGKDFRDYGEVLDDVSAKWSTMSEIDKKAIAVAFGQTRNQDKFLTLIDNYSQAMEYSKVAANSAGTALDKYENSYLNSIEAKQEKFIAQFEQLSTTIWNDDIIKGTFDTGTGLLGILTWIVDTFKMIPILATASTVALSKFGNKGIYKTYDKIKDDGTSELAVGNFRTIKKQEIEQANKAYEEQIQIISEDVKLMTQYQNNHATATDRTKLFEDTLGKASEQAQNQAEALQKGSITATVWGENQKKAAQAVKEVGVQAQVSSVKIQALATIKNIAVGFGIGLILQGLTWGITKLINSQQDAIDKANELTASYKTTTDEISSSLKTLESSTDVFNKLSKGVDDYGNNISLTADEYEQYKNIVKQILEISPSLITGYDNEGNAISNKNGLLEASIALQKEELKLKREKITSSDELWNVANGYNEDYSKKEKELKSHKDSLENIIKDIASTSFFNDLSGVPKEKNDFIADVLGIDKETVTQKGQLLYGYAHIIEANIEKIYKQASLRTDLFTSEDLNKFKTYINEKKKLELQLDKQSQKLNPILQEIPKNVTEYEKLSDAQRSFITEYINGFKITPETINNKAAITKISQDILNFTQSISDNPIVQNAVNELLALDKAKIPYGEWKETATELSNTIADSLGLTDGEKKEFILKFNLDNLDNTIKEIDSEMSKVSSDEIKTLTDEEIRVGYAIENKGNMSFSEFKGAIEDVKKEASKLTFVSYNTILAPIAEDVKTLSEAYKEMSENGNLSSKTVSELLTKFPELQTSLKSVNGTLTISKDILQQKANAIHMSSQAEILSQINANKTTIETNNESIKSIKSLIEIYEEKIKLESLMGGYSYQNHPLYEIFQNSKSKINEIKTENDKLLTENKNFQTAMALSDAQHKENFNNGIKNVIQSKIDYGKKVDDINKGLVEKEKSYAESMSQAWKTDANEKFKDEIAKRKDTIDKYTNSIKALDFGLGFTDDTNVIGKMDMLGEKFALATEKGKAMSAEFNRLKNIQYGTGEQAQALSSRISELGEEIRTNISDLVSLTHEIDMLRISAISNVLDNQVTNYEREISILDDKLKLITDGSGRGKYGKQLLFSFDFLIPDIPKSLVDKKRAEDKQIIELEKSKQNTINELVSEALAIQAKENAEAREKERARLSEDMNKARAEAKKQLDEAKKEHEKTMKDMDSKTKYLINSIENYFANADIKLADIDLSSLDALIEKLGNVKTAMNSSMSNNPYNIQSYNPDFKGNAGSNMANIASNFVGQSNSNYKFSGGRNEEWCADFITYLANASGVSTDQLIRSSSVKAYKNFFEKTNNLYTKPNTGDLIIFGDKSHIGIVESVNGDKIGVIEGNTGNKDNRLSRVARNNYSISKLIKNGTKFGRFAQGGTTTSERALVGEEGFEQAILPNGKMVMLGKKGAELVDLPIGTQIIPHEETKEILYYTGDMEGKTIPKYASGTSGKSKTKTEKPATVQIQTTEDVFKYIKKINDEMLKSTQDFNKKYTQEQTKWLVNYGKLGSELEKDDAAFDKMLDMKAKQADQLGKVAVKAGKALMSGLQQYLKDVENNVTKYDQRIVDSFLTEINKVQETVKKADDALMEILTQKEDRMQSSLESKDHRVFLLQQKKGYDTTDQQVNIYRSAQDDLHRQAEAYRKAGFSEDSKEIRNLSKQWYDYEQKIVNTYETKEQLAQKANQSSKNAIEDLLELTIAMIRKEKEEEKKHHEENIKNKTDEINLQKESLRDKEEERDYGKDLKDRQKEISKLQADLDALKFDNSADAKKKRLELEEQLAEKKEELDEFQHDKEVDRADKALDDELERFEKLEQGKIDTIDEYLDDEGKLRQDAANLIEGKTTEFYNRLLAYNKQYGTGID